MSMYSQQKYNVKLKIIDNLRDKQISFMLDNVN